MPRKAQPLREPIERADPLREWPWIQAAISRLRKIPHCSLTGLPVTCLVRLTRDFGFDREAIITEGMLLHTVFVADSLGLFREVMSEDEWLRRVRERKHFHHPGCKLPIEAGANHGD